MYTVVEKIPKGIVPVDTKWVMLIKKNVNGSVEKFKSQKVGTGFTQVDGVNYDKDATHAQTMRAETMKLLIVILESCTNRYMSCTNHCMALSKQHMSGTKCSGISRIVSDAEGVWGIKESSYQNSQLTNPSSELGFIIYAE